jgi:hypothetical protein
MASVSGTCPWCGAEHRLALSYDAQTDADALIALSADTQGSGDVKVSTEAIGEMVRAGAFVCPKAPKRSQASGMPDFAS